jgi:hypothetical protein
VTIEFGAAMRRGVSTNVSVPMHVYFGDMPQGILKSDAQWIYHMGSNPALCRVAQFFS